MWTLSRCIRLYEPGKGALWTHRSAAECMCVGLACSDDAVCPSRLIGLPDGCWTGGALTSEDLDGIGAAVEEAQDTTGCATFAEGAKATLT